MRTNPFQFRSNDDSPRRRTAETLSTVILRFVIYHNADKTTNDFSTLAGPRTNSRHFAVDLFEEWHFTFLPFWLGLGPRISNGKRCTSTRCNNAMPWISRFVGLVGDPADGWRRDIWLTLLWQQLVACCSVGCQLRNNTKGIINFNETKLK